MVSEQKGTQKPAQNKPISQKIGNVEFTLPDYKPPKHDPVEYRRAAKLIDDILADCGLATYGNSGFRQSNE